MKDLETMLQSEREEFLNHMTLNNIIKAGMFSYLPEISSELGFDKNDVVIGIRKLN